MRRASCITGGYGYRTEWGVRFHGVCSAVSWRAVVSCGASLLTLLTGGSLGFILEVAPVALFEAPLLLFSFNLRTTGGRQNLASKPETPEEARWPRTGLHRQSARTQEAALDSRLGDQKRERYVSLSLCLATGCVLVSTRPVTAPPDVKWIHGWMLNVYIREALTVTCVCVCTNTHSTIKDRTLLHSGATFAGCHNFKGCLMV